MKFVLIWPLLFFSIQVRAIDFEDAVFPEHATSGRALAMGNAFGAKVDDSTAVFYNPAGLGTVRYPHLHLSNFHLELNKGWMNTAAGGKATAAFGNISKALTIDGTRQLLKNQPGEISHSRIHLLPNFTARFISMGYLYAKRTRAVVTDTASATGFEYADRTDTGPYAALNLSLFGGVIKFGASALYLIRKEVKGSADPNQTITVSANQYDGGHMLAVTSGARLTLPVEFLPTVSATMRNSTSAEFTKLSSSNQKPTKIPQSIDVAASITPQIGQIVRVHLEADWKDIGGAYKDVSTTRKMLFGLEFDLARVFFVRFGYGDGFGSAGLGIKSQRLEFDLTTYAVDTSTSAWRGREDRRFSITLSSGF